MPIAQVPAYAKALIARFENPDLAHRLDQIAMDGSQKVPYRFVETLRDGNAPAVLEGIKAWVTFCIHETTCGRPVNDPKTALLKLIGAEDLAPLFTL